MPKIEILFNKGTQLPPKLGTVILKPTAKGFASYAQNIDFHNDEYGNSVILPGPVLNTIGSNSELTGVPIIHSKFGLASSNVGYIYFAEGILGATNKIRRVKDVEDTETPVIDTTGSFTVTHGAHTSVVVQDMEYFKDNNNNNFVYVSGVDATDVWVQRFDPTSGTPSLTSVATNEDSDSALKHYLLRGDDNLMYYGWFNRLDSYDPNNAHAETEGKLNLPATYGMTALGKWQDLFAIAYHTPNYPFDFSQRLASGEAGVILWDYAPTSSLGQRDVRINNTYISALVKRPSGQLIVFGGLREGKTTIYQFAGFGFDPVFSYVGDMPRSRHSVDFDSQGRMLWMTADGQICRYDFTSELFEHLGTISTTLSAGGIFTSLLGSTGNEFLAASGNGSTYLMKKMQFGIFIGDGDAADDGVTTPLVISGLQALPPHSMIKSVQTILQKNLSSGEKLAVRIYKNGSTTATSYGTLSFSGDAARAGKTIFKSLYEVNNFALGYAWKMADNTGNAPGVLRAVVEYEPLR